MIPLFNGTSRYLVFGQEVLCLLLLQETRAFEWPEGLKLLRVCWADAANVVFQIKKVGLPPGAYRLQVTGGHAKVVPL